ncbi:hypothetical protein GYH30_053657 [Glycine max]|nr:hypothetical protein GYH30_053657 [Glycine max]
MLNWIQCSPRLALSSNLLPPIPLPSSADNDDDLSHLGEAATPYHQHLHRRPPNPNALFLRWSKTEEELRPQFHLDFGQSDFIVTRLFPLAGINSLPATQTTEIPPTTFTNPTPRGYNSEVGPKKMLFPLPTSKRVESFWFGDRLTSHRSIVEQVVKPIEKAFKVVSGSPDSVKKREVRTRSTTLRFGNVIFQREVEKKVASLSDSERMEGAIFCDSKPTTAACGIRAIWVAPSNRRKGIASKLLDAVRKSFCKDLELERSQLAFSQPTSAGKALATSYTGTGSFLAY